MEYCQACLCNQRTLYPLHLLHDVLQDLQDISGELKNTDGGICWECKSIIFKFIKLKKQIRQVQEILNNAEKDKNLQSLSTLSCTFNHIYDYEYDVSCDPLGTAESDIEIHIKQEYVDNDHNELYAKDDIISHETFITDSTIDNKDENGMERDSDNLIKIETLKQEHEDVMFYQNDYYLQPEVDCETYSSEQLSDRIEEPLEPTNIKRMDYNYKPNDYVHLHLKKQKNKIVKTRIKKGAVTICFTLPGFNVKIMQRLLSAQNTWAGIKFWELKSSEKIGDSTFLKFDIPRKYVTKLMAKKRTLQYSLGNVQVMFYKNGVRSKKPPTLKSKSVTI